MFKNIKVFSIKIIDYVSCYSIKLFKHPQSQTIG